MPSKSFAQTQRPLTIRVNLTVDEWTKVRHIALDRNESPAETVAHALRSTYNLNGETK